MKVTVALIQVSPPGIAPGDNVERGVQLIREAARLGADVAVFPEMWSIGYADCPFDVPGRDQWEGRAIERDSDYLRSFAASARRERIHLAVTYLSKGIVKPRNTVALINDCGDLVLEYSKVYICNFGVEQLTAALPDRRKVGSDFNCAAGNEFKVVDIVISGGPVRVGLMICADREFPQASWHLMNLGAELVFVPNSCTWDMARAAQLRTRAFDNLFGVAMTNYPEPKNNGGSSAYTCVNWDERGRFRDPLLLHAPAHEGIYTASFDLDAIRSFRSEEAWRLDYQRAWSHNPKTSLP